MFGYLLGHSHRYFQDNFAGKLGQKIKKAGQACTGLLEILCFEVTRILVVLAVATGLLIGQQPFYATVLLVWMVGYIALSYVLTRRCVVLSHAYSAEVSTSTGRLVRSEEHTSELQSLMRI